MSTFDIGSVDLTDIVSDLIARSKITNSKSRSMKNLIDPYAAALESILNNLAHKDWLLTESMRTAQKNLLNHIGDAQQRMIGALDGWTSYASGSGMPDVVGIRGSQKIIAEVKNKHNTMNDKGQKATYDELAKFLKLPKFKGFTAIVVTMIAPKSHQTIKPFAPGKLRVRRDDILIASGRVFYAIATDHLQRTPTVQLAETYDLTKWSSWSALDSMIEEFWTELERQSGKKIPKWVKDLVEQAYG